MVRVGRAKSEEMKDERECEDWGVKREECGVKVEHVKI